ncbi:MAG TPA: twin-arginine translocation signal domain-containing protein, partial [Thermomicrobiales bacterium]
MTPTSGPLLNRRRFVGMSAALSAALAMNLPRLTDSALAQSAEQTLRVPCEEPETYDTGTVGGGIGIQWTNHLFEG